MDKSNNNNCSGDTEKKLTTRNPVECLVSENGLSENAEIIVYDALKIIEKQAKLLLEIIKKHGTERDKREYKECVYAPAIKLQVVLGSKGIARQKERYVKIQKELDEFLKRKSR